MNVVVTANLGYKLNLEALSSSGYILHDEMIYGGRVGYFRSPEFSGEVTLFPSGKMIGVGENSEDGACHQLEFVKDTLVREGIIEPVTLSPKIQNIVATVDLGRRVDLEGLVAEFDLDFEPEQFPGAIMRLRESCVATVLIFSSGKAVITGAKTYDEIAKATKELMNAVADHTK